MNPFNLRLPRICLAHIAIVFGLAISLFFMPTFGLLGNQMQVQAKPLTPEAVSYEIDSPNSPKTIGNDQESRDRNPDEIKNSQGKLKNAADNIQDKLNLDKAVPEGTKDFINRLEGKETGSLKKR